MDDDEFQRRRQEKIADIRRTGKTWQWPDPVPHRQWTTGHLAVLMAVLLACAVVLVVLT